MGKLEQSRKILALMELNFLISAINLALGSMNQIASLKIWLMEWYPYMIHGNIFDTVCEGYEMPQFISFYPLYPTVSIYSIVALLCHMYYTTDRKIIGKLRICLCILCWMTLRSIFQCNWIIVILLTSLCSRSLKMTGL